MSYGRILPSGVGGTIPVGGLTNAEVSATAAIAYSKLALALSLVNGDIAAAAGITRSKFAGYVVVQGVADIPNDNVASAAATGDGWWVMATVTLTCGTGTARESWQVEDGVGAGTYTEAVGAALGAATLVGDAPVCFFVPPGRTFKRVKATTGTGTVVLLGALVVKGA